MNQTHPPKEPSATPAMYTAGLTLVGNFGEINGPVSTASACATITPKAINKLVAICEQELSSQENDDADQLCFYQLWKALKKIEKSIDAACPGFSLPLEPTG